MTTIYPLIRQIYIALQKATHTCRFQYCFKIASGMHTLKIDLNIYLKKVKQFSQLWLLWSKCDLCSLYIHFISNCMILYIYTHTHHKSIFNLRVECNLKQKTRPSFGNFGVQICSNWGYALVLELFWQCRPLT